MELLLNPNHSHRRAGIALPARGLRVLLALLGLLCVSFMPLEIKWNTDECWNTWNVVCSYWFALVPDLLVKSVVLLLDFLLVLGVGARDADNWRRFFLWIQHCSQAVPSIFLSRGIENSYF